MIQSKPENYKKVLHNYTRDIIGACSPLFSCGPIKYFNYARYYKDGDILCVSTMPKWYDYYVNNSNFVITAANKVFCSDEIILWEDSFPEILAVAKKDFDLESPIVFVRNDNNEYKEVFCFAAKAKSKEKNIIEYYFNNIEKLKGFSFHINKLKSVNKAFNAEKNIPKKADQRKLLTERETDCYMCLLRGEGGKEISETLNISLSTVNEHLSSLREKLSCYSRSSLIKKAISLRLLDFNIFNPDK